MHSATRYLNRHSGLVSRERGLPDIRYPIETFLAPNVQFGTARANGRSYRVYFGVLVADSVCE